MDGQKMAKSAGNFQRVTELVDRGLDPLAFRYLVLTSRYGRKLEYSDRLDRGRGCGARVAARRDCARSAQPPIDGPWARPAGRCGRGPPATGRTGVAAGAAGHGDGRRATVPGDRAARPPLPCPRPGRALHDRFVAAIDDDLDMPAALALLREILRAPRRR